MYGVMKLPRPMAACKFQAGSREAPFLVVSQSAVQGELEGHFPGNLPREGALASQNQGQARCGRIARGGGARKAEKQLADGSMELLPCFPRGKTWAWARAWGWIAAVARARAVSSGSAGADWPAPAMEAGLAGSPEIVEESVRRERQVRRAVRGVLFPRRPASWRAHAAGSTVSPARRGGSSREMRDVWGVCTESGMLGGEWDARRRVGCSAESGMLCGV